MKLDKEVENIDINEKIKQKQEITKKEKGFVRKKYKPIEKEEKHNKKIKFIDNKMNISYDGFYDKEVQKRIENKLCEKVENIGINEITNNIINNIVDSTNKKKQLKEKKKKCSKN